ncbi:MAG: transglutaminase-like domain-containing protein [Planctomycetaceae bacterium]
MTTRFSLLVLLLTTAAFGQTRDEWCAIYLDGEHVGFERTRYAYEAERIVTRRTVRVKTRRFRIDRETRTESIAETATLQRCVSRDGREKSTISIGENLGGYRMASVLKSGRTTTNQLPLDVRSPFWFQQQLIANPMPVRTKVRFNALEGSDSVAFTITSGNWRTTILPSRERMKLLPLTVVRSDKPVGSQMLYMNKRGQIQLSEFQHDGLTMLKQLTQRSKAQTEQDARQFDILLTQFVTTDQSLKDGRDATEAVYRITGLPDGETLDHAPRQLSTATKDGAIELQVSTSELKSGREHKRVHSDYLKSTKLIDHTHTSVQQFAREAAAGEFDAALIAKKLQRAVGNLVRNRTFSAATLPASEILQTKRGDCTEHSVLLAAALRARRIPSRVVVGLIYLDGKNAFAAHMWTEGMINGKWTALDATFARPRHSEEATRVPGAGYVTVAHSCLPGDETALDVFMPLADLMQEVEIEIAE